MHYVGSSDSAYPEMHSKQSPALSSPLMFISIQTAQFLNLLQADKIFIDLRNTSFSCMKW